MPMMPSKLERSQTRGGEVREYTSGERRRHFKWLPSLLKLGAAYSLFAWAAWWWAGESAHSRCAVVCCVLIPFINGGLCCWVVGGVLKRVAGSKAVRTRMDVPILGGIALGTATGCALTPYVCDCMCRFYHVDACMYTCQTILPGLVFATISSAIVFIVAFGDAPTSQGGV